MKQNKSWIKTAIVMAGGLALVGSAMAAPITVETFDNFVPAYPKYGTWSTAGIVSNTNSFDVTVTSPGSATFGGCGTGINIDASSKTNVELTVKITCAAGVLVGPIVVFTDNVGNSWKWAWYGLPAGTYVLDLPLASPTIKVTPTVNLTNLTAVDIQVDQGGSPGTYTIQWQNLALTGAGDTTGGGGGTGCATIDAFDGTALNGYNGGWSTATILSTSTNLQISGTGSSGFGDAFQAITPTVSTTSNLTLSLDVTLTASDVMGPVVVLQDGSGNQMQYLFLNTAPGHHVLTAALNSGALVSGAGPFNFATLSFFHMQLNPEGVTGPYTMAINDMSVTGCGGSGGPTGCGPIDAFDGTALNGYSGGWSTATVLSTSTNLQITASGANGFADAFQAITPVVATVSNLSLSLDVTLTASDVMGPVVVIQDGGGNQMQYLFLNTPPGHQVLTAPLTSGTLVSGAGPFNFATLSFFHMQLNPEGVTGTYTMAINDLSVTGCGGSGSGITITSKSYNPATRQVSLTWTSAANQQYSILYSATVNGTYGALLTNIASGGATTSQSVQLPIGATGFVKIQQQ